MAFDNAFFENLASLTAEQLRGIPILGLCLFTLGSSAVVFLCSVLYNRKRDRKIPFRKQLLLCLALFYACFLVMITLMNRDAGSRGGVFTDVFTFLSGGRLQSMQKLVYAVLNVLLFIPCGVVLAFLWEADAAGKRLIMISLCCFVVSVAIESLQLATARGYFEVEDILANTFGGFMGALLAGVPLYFLNRKT